MKQIRIVNLILIATVILIAASCNSNDVSERYPINKKYWDASDYENVIGAIKNSQGEIKKPSFSDIETAVVVRKLTDKNNLNVVLCDTSLGISHRNDFAKNMFEKFKDMSELYQERDREDKFIFPLENVEISKFGLNLQMLYFSTGNENNIKNSDNPNNAETQNILNENIQVLIRNFDVYLSQTKDEKSYSTDALKSYIDGINEYFPKLINKYPNSDYSEMKTKSQDMISKATSKELRLALTSIISKIDGLKKNSP